MNFQEEFLHFIWQFRLYDSRKLYTTTNEYVKVIQQGFPNKNAGPDFTNAKLQIAETTWVGNVEIHIRSSDWLLHQHHFDKAYENVILHIVYEDDEKIYRKDGTLLPVLVIKDLFPSYLLDNYENLISSANLFPCEKHIHNVDRFLINSFLSKVLVERLIQKAEEIAHKLDLLKGDWNEAFYHFLSKSFGFKVNAVPMEILAQSLPHQLLAKHKDNQLQVEALIFGQAGFLGQKFTHEYPKKLKREYLFLKRKYELKPIDVSLWKFMRMRPQNFPTLRLAQFAALIFTSNHLFSKILAISNRTKIEDLFENLPVNHFWQTHFHFNKNAEHVKLQLGKDSINHILINTISIFLFAYGRSMDQYEYIKRALDLLEQLPPENNSILKQFINVGVEVQNAFSSQALLQLKKMYCNEKKCLNCTIGIKILKS